MPSSDFTYFYILFGCIILFIAIWLLAFLFLPGLIGKLLLRRDQVLDDQD